VVDQIFSKDAVLNKLKETKKTISGGTKFVQPIKIDGLNRGTYKANKAGNSFNIDEKEIINAVDIPVRGHYANLTVDGFEEAINSGTAAVHNLLEEKMKDLEEAMRQELLDALYGAGTADGFQGLQSMVSDSNTYAGLDRTVASNDFWRSHVVADAVAGVDLTSDSVAAYRKLRDFYMASTDGGNEAKNVIFVCDFSTHSIIEALLAEKNRITTVDETQANLGFDNFKLFGKPVFASSKLEAQAQASGKGILYALNFDFLGMKTLAGRDFHMTKFKESQSNDSRAKQLLLMGNYTTSKPQRLAVMKDILI
jgi:hypothetical protein